MDYFKKKCPECGKENPVGNPNAEGFCNRMCESNYKFRKNRMLHGTGSKFVK